MKLVLKNVRNLDGFVEYLRNKGYSVSEGAHAVLTDHSEILELYISRDDDLVAVIIAHYISQYYMVEAEDVKDDEEYLKKLLEIKHSGSRWRVPVNPLSGIVIDESMIDVLEKYSDEYPVEDAGRLVQYYRSKNPGYKNIPKIAIARLLEKLGSGD